MAELSSEQIDVELEVLEKKMARLRVLYEQFFQGIERTPPYQVQKDVVRILHELQHQRIRQTTQKFRLQSLTQRFSAMKAYWSRTTREIEEGRYRKQIARSRSAPSEADVDELTIQDLAAIRAVREQHGEEAAREAEERRRADRVAQAAARKKSEADEAERFLQEMGVSASAAEEAPQRGGGPTASQRSAARMAASRESENPEPAAPSDEAAAASARASAPSEEPVLRGMSADALREAAEKTASGSQALDERTQRLREMRERLRRAQGGGDAASASPAATAGASAADRRARAVFDRLVKTKAQLNENTANLSFESVRRSLDRQAEQVRQKRGCRDVDFDVVVRDGKAFLKAIPVD